MSKPKTNAFTAAFSRSTPEEVAPATPPTAPTEQKTEAARANIRPSRRNRKHVGGYFDPAVHKQLRLLAAEEDRHIEELLAEGLDMLFHSRRKPTIAQRSTG